MLNAIWQAKAGYQELILCLIVALALWRGASPERRIAATFVAMIVLDRLYHLTLPEGAFWIKIDLGHCAIDFASTVSISIIALRANRIYPICLGALQLAAMISHIAIGLNPSLLRGAYAVLMIAPSYLQIVVFGSGLLLHLRRRAKFGQYRSWQPY